MLSSILLVLIVIVLNKFYENTVYTKLYRIFILQYLLLTFFRKEYLL